MICIILYRSVHFVFNSRYVEVKLNKCNFELYRVRVQAVNGIGVGPFSSPVKFTTRALPPSPPKLECMAVAPNSLKLKWGDGRNVDLLTYTLEMDKEDGK